MPDSDPQASFMTAVGAPWLIALMALLMTSICEAARPRSHEADPAWLLALRIGASAAAIVTPLLLFLHAFWAIAGFADSNVTAERVVDAILARRVTIVALLILMGVMVVAASLFGWLIGRAAPGAGLLLYRLAPPLALLVCVLTICVTWRNAVIVFDLFLRSQGWR